MTIRFTRRQWVKAVFGGGLALASGLLLNDLRPLRAGGRPKVGSLAAAGDLPATLEAEAKVVIAQQPDLAGTPKKLAELIHRGVQEVTGEDGPEAAWSKLFEPSDVVGIKLSCLSGKKLSPHPELVDAIVEGLRMAGVPDPHIILWDRLNRDLRRAGYAINTSDKGVKCIGTDAVGFDPKLYESGSVGSFFSNILSKHSTAIINVPVLKDHDLAGVSVALKNFYGAIHNPNKYHGSNCDPYIAELYSHPLIRGKVRLTICDALVAQYNAGPGYSPRYSWKYDGVLISLDPVALDRVGTMLIEAKRKENGLPTLREVGREPSYIATAASMGLGIDDPERIRVIKI